MDRTFNHSTKNGPGGLMIFSSAAMTLGSLLSGFILLKEASFFGRNNNFLTEQDIIVSLLILLLILLELAYAFSVLRIKLELAPYDSKSMRILAILMLVLNCAVFVLCAVFVAGFEDWTPQGYFTTSAIFLPVLLPGIYVKILALAGINQ